MADDAPPDGHPLRWFRNSFFAGVAIVLPFAVTWWLLSTFVELVDGYVVPILPMRMRGTAEVVPGAGIVIAMTLLTVIGALAGNFIGRSVIDEVDGLVARLPIIRSIYGASKQVLKQFAEPEQRSFKDAVLIQFPHPGSWAIGFITNAEPDLVTPGLVAVYVPHAPIPTSGFLIYAARSDLIAVEGSAEEALKRVISLGAAQLPGNAKSAAGQVSQTQISQT